MTFSNDTDRSRYRLGFTRGDWTGTFPGARQTRNTLSLTGDMQLSDRLRADVSLNYYDRTLTNPPPRVYVAYSFPRSLKTDLLKQDYETPAGYLTTPQIYARLHPTEADMIRQVFWTGLAGQYVSGGGRARGAATLPPAPAGRGQPRGGGGGPDSAPNPREGPQHPTARRARAAR